MLSAEKHDEFGTTHIYHYVCRASEINDPALKSFSDESIIESVMTLCVEHDKSMIMCLNE